MVLEVAAKMAEIVVTVNHIETIDLTGEQEGIEVSGSLVQLLCDGAPFASGESALPVDCARHVLQDWVSLHIVVVLASAFVVSVSTIYSPYQE